MEAIGKGKPLQELVQQLSTAGEFSSLNLLRAFTQEPSARQG